jgi:hypothetical protein
VRLDDPSASRVHCRLLARKGKVFLTDAGSRWGTFVNGRRVADCELRPGDEITVGGTSLQLEATGTPDATTLARRSEVRQPFLPDEEPAAWPTSPNLPYLGAVTQKPPSVLPAAMPVMVEGLDQEKRCQPVASVEPKPAGQCLPGMCFGEYQVRERLARTSSGQVFLATSLATQQDVALKIFAPAAMSEDKDRQRFVRAIGLMRGL